MEGHALGLNSNETKVSDLQCSLPRNKNLFEPNQAPWCSKPFKISLTLEGHQNRSNEGYTKNKLGPLYT